jgi:hypothetical protein
MDNDLVELQKKFRNYNEDFAPVQSYEMIVREICLYKEWPYGEVWMPQKDQKLLTYYTSWDNGNPKIVGYKKFSELCKFGGGVGFIGQVWEKNNVVIVKDLLSDKNFVREEVARTSGIKTGYGFPFQSGVMAFFSTGYKEGDEEVIKILYRILQ